MFWILHQILFTHIGAIRMNEPENLTLYDIQRASTNYLKSCLKYDIDVEVDDMINKELYIREHRRPIGQSDLIINEWLLKKS